MRCAVPLGWPRPDLAAFLDSSMHPPRVGRPPDLDRPDRATAACSNTSRQSSTRQRPSRPRRCPTLATRSCCTLAGPTRRAAILIFLWRGCERGGGVGLPPSSPRPAPPRRAAILIFLWRVYERGGVLDLLLAARGLADLIRAWMGRETSSAG